MKLLMTLTSCVLIIAGALPATAQTLNTAKLDSLMTALQDNNKAMGSLAISRKGQLLYTRSIGAGYHMDGKPVAPDRETMYRIGSITKMFTAVMIFKLIEEKKLTIETPLSRFFPAVPGAKAITIGMMMSHRSGIHSLTDDSAYLSWHTKPQTREALLQRITRSKPVFPPDSSAAYSNSNYVLLGWIVSDLTGKPYAKAVQDYILKPLNLKRTALSEQIRPERNEAASYRWTGDSWEKEAETDVGIPGGAGALAASPADLTRFIEGLFAGKLISAASLQQMTTLYGPGGKPAERGMGMGAFRFPFGARRAWGHNGGIDGFRSSLSYFPQDSLAVALCLNGVNYDMNTMMIGILSIAFGQSYQLPTFQEVALPEAVLARYPGTYASEQMPLKITIRTEGGGLTAQATGQGAFPLTPVSDTTFEFTAAGIRMEFSKSGDQYDRFVLKQGGGQYLFKRE